MFRLSAGYYVAHQAILAYRSLWSGSVSGLDVIGVLVGEPWVPTGGGVQAHFLRTEALSHDCTGSGSLRQSICRLAWSAFPVRCIATHARPNSRIRKKGGLSHRIHASVCALRHLSRWRRAAACALPGCNQEGTGMRFDTEHQLA